MRDQLKELTSRSPRPLGLSRSRWTLGMLRKSLGEKAPETNAGTWQMLDRPGITHTRGQGYVLSPDEHFEAKRAFIDGIRTRTGTETKADQEAPSSEESGNSSAETGSTENDSEKTDRLFYLDELTYELHPTISSDWSPAGEQPTAQRGTGGQREGRLLAAMDAGSGSLFYRQKQSVGREKLVDLYREMVSAFEVGACGSCRTTPRFTFTPTCSGHWRRRCGLGPPRLLNTPDRHSGRTRPTRPSPVGSCLCRSFLSQPMPLGSIRSSGCGAG